ncbi:PorV/PorQ family protein [candidate division KSB1 bacterium]|nr:PorV/PorQ family protein [candidate division KSB1 bacterium]
MKRHENIKRTCAWTAILVLSLAVQSSFGQQNFKRLGKSGFTFLKLAPSARAAAMGDAFTAVATDASALFWNPAGMTHIQRFAYGFTYGKWIVDSRLTTVAGAYKFGRFAAGLSAISFSPQEFEETTISAPGGTGRVVSGGDIALGAALAVQFTDKLSFGCKVHWIEETIDHDKTSGFTVDFSTFYRTGFRDMVLAMAMKNFGPEQKYLYENFKMPLIFNISSAINVVGRSGSPMQFLVTGESSFATDFRDRYHLGGEVWIMDMLALRGGYKFYYDLEDYSLGMGIKLTLAGKPFTFDVAYTNVLEYFEAPLKFTIGGEL